MIADARQGTRHSGPRTKKRPLAPQRSAKWLPKSPRDRFLVAAAAAALFALLLFGVLFSMRTPDGTLVVEISDPEATVQVLDARGKLLIEQKAGGEKVEISVVPGKGKLRVVKNGATLLTKEFSLLAGGRETINAKVIPPRITQTPNIKPPPPIVPKGPVLTLNWAESQRAGASWFVDGTKQDLPPTGPIKVPLPPKKDQYELRFERPGFQTQMFRRVAEEDWDYTVPEWAVLDPDEGRLVSKDAAAAWQRRFAMAAPNPDEAKKVIEEFDNWKKTRTFADNEAGAMLHLMAAAILKRLDLRKEALQKCQEGLALQPQNSKVRISLERLSLLLAAESGKPVVAPVGSGTGYCIAEGNYLLTNHHVIYGAKEIKVRLNGQTEMYPAEMVADNSAGDMAILKVDLPAGKRLMPIQLMANKLRTGEDVTVLGWPGMMSQNLTLTLTKGVVSTVPDTDDNESFIVTDCTVNPGNSGGPMCSFAGGVAGMVTRKSSITSNQSSYGMAIPAGRLRKFLAEKLPKDAKMPPAQPGSKGANLKLSELAEKIAPSVVYIENIQETHVPGGGAKSQGEEDKGTVVATPTAGPAGLAKNKAEEPASVDDGSARAKAANSADDTAKANGQVPAARKTETEEHVAAALDWLARHQMVDGSWNIADFGRRCKDRTCSGTGNVRADSGATAMGLLPLLASGNTHKTPGPYRKNIQAGLDWLLNHQTSNGDLASGAQQPMYSHGLATIALCEAYGLSKDLTLRSAAQMAVNYIVNAQNKTDGGWRYNPGDRGDTSVTAWQVTALKSAKLAGLNVRAASFTAASKWLDSVAINGGTEYTYQPGVFTAATMTSAGLLCRQYLGAKRDNPMLTGGVSYLMNHLPDEAQSNIYYCYYANQVMHKWGGNEWDAWHGKMRDLLLRTQVRNADACANGSWDPTKDAWGKYGGRVMMTSLAALILQVGSSPLPIYK
jgi:S1-C subfamily serine protease